MSQEDLEVAISNTANVQIGEVLRGQVIDLDFKYQPGFKIGLGINSDYDDWNGLLEYTRIHATHRVSSGAPNTGLGVLALQQFNEANSSAIGATLAEGSWRIELDIVDLELARSNYVATHLTFRPFFGVRAAWIDQRYTVKARNSTIAPQTYEVKQTSKTWGLGPRAGVDTNWLLGCGFRLIGNFAADLLYTRYKISRTEDQDTNPSILFANINEKRRFLRAHTELAVGMGWGTYFDHTNWHFDLAASYDFNIFLHQNMLRWFPNNSISRNSKGDLFLHGLTLCARLDF